MKNERKSHFSTLFQSLVARHLQEGAGSEPCLVVLPVLSHRFYMMVGLQKDKTTWYMQRIVQ